VENNVLRFPIITEKSFHSQVEDYSSFYGHYHHFSPISSSGQINRQVRLRVGGAPCDHRGRIHSHHASHPQAGRPALPPAARTRGQLGGICGNGAQREPG